MVLLPEPAGPSMVMMVSGAANFMAIYLIVAGALAQWLCGSYNMGRAGVVATKLSGREFRVGYVRIVVSRCREPSGRRMGFFAVSRADGLGLVKFVSYN